jgi:hypothetical protein
MTIFVELPKVIYDQGPKHPTDTLRLRMPSRFPPDNLVMFLLSSIEQIHLHIAGLSPRLSAVSFIVSNKVLSKAPLYQGMLLR